MSRLRYTYTEAQQEATRLATEYLSKLPGAEKARLKGVQPDNTAPKSRATKFPVVWSVCFVFHPPDVVMDGGELFLKVNVETMAVVPP